MPSPSDVDPRTSAKRIAVSTSAPPGAMLSQQRVHRFGFFGDGRKPASANTLPPIPPNGLEHTLQRGEDGTARKTRRPRTKDAWPSTSSLCQSSLMARHYRRAAPADDPHQPL